MEGGIAPVNDAHYRLYAFVCSHTCVRRADRDPPPTATFEQIYQIRPKDCRYAVVGVWDVARNGDRFIVWDLFATKMQFTQGGHLPGKLLAPAPRLTHDDLDAAIMATVLLYNTEPKRTL